MLNELKKRLLKDYEIPVVFEDNTTAIKHAKSDDVPALRHLVKIHLNFIRSQVQEKKIKLVWISTNDQLDDFMTKPLGTKKFEYFRDCIMSKKLKF